MNPWIVALLLATLSPPAAVAQPSSADGKTLDPKQGPANYGLCLDTARTFPEQGLEIAERWEKLGGGEPAQHCAGVSLIGLGRYLEAGKALEALGLSSKQSPDLRAGLLAQAGQAWLLGGDLDHAVEDQSAALKLLNVGAPATVPILIDRAESYGQLKRYKEALADLDAALKIAPSNADALAFRANAHRGLDQLPDALKDAEAAVAANPSNLNALLERGIAYRLSGQAEAARADWTRVIELAPNTAAADTAKADLIRLDSQAPRDPKAKPKGALDAAPNPAEKR